jgi:hypothetical protein
MSTPPPPPPDAPADPLADLSSLAGFTPARVLHNDRETRCAAVLGDLGGAHAILRLAREPFDDARLASGEGTRGVRVTPVVRNDMCVCFCRCRRARFFAFPVIISSP